MINLTKNQHVEYLKAFLRLFEARVTSYSILTNGISGRVEWPDDEDTQDVLWSIDLDSGLPEGATEVCEYLAEHNLVDGDVVIISEEELLRRLVLAGWSQNVAVKAVDYLFSTDVSMIDEGVATDSFFLHL